MNLSSSREFPYSMKVAWEALHKPGKLDVEPGSDVTEISDFEWEAHNRQSKAVSRYTAAFDDENMKVTIESSSNKKHEHDFIYLTLTEVDSDRVKLDIEMEINTGVHFIAKALGTLISKPAQQIVCNHIYENFKALCEGGQTKRMTSEELKDIAEGVYKK